MADKGGYIGRNPGDSAVTIARLTNAPTGVQTSFTFPSTYIPGLLDVYINGSRLIDITDYSATDGSTISLTSAAESGDVLEFVAYKAFNVGNVTNASGDFTVDNNLTVNGYISAGGTITGTEFYGSGTNLTGIVTSITAGNNISVSGATGNVTITGLANTSNVIADTIVTGSLVVTGISTLGSTVATSLEGPLTSTGVNVTGIVTATSFEGDGSSLTGIAQPTQLDITSSLFT
tara:strand:- start:403 stop:1101 length:699 start_codon:yes stop_codon:yes gene_type:complete